MKALKLPVTTGASELASDSDDARGEPRPTQPRLLQTSAVAVLVLAAAIVAAPLAGHIDDTDAQLYRVVVRHMVEDGAWVDLRYLPDAHPEFREHLPFGFWPKAAVVHVFGMGGLAPLNAMFTLTTIGLVGWAASRLLSARAAVVAMLVLALTETFIVYGGRPRLDPLLVMLSFGAALPFAQRIPTRRGLALASCAAAAAVLVKGPFGLVALIAASAARALVTRSFRGLWLGALAAIISVLPLGAFLLWDRTAAGGTWWTGYVENQVLASAAGARTDGATHVLFPLATIAGRFWPGLPLVLVGVIVAITGRGPRVTASRVIALWSVLTIAALCVPSRKIWNHALVAYPTLALLAAAGAETWLERIQSERWSSTARRALVATAAVAVVGSLLGAGRLLLPAPCIVQGELAAELARFTPGTHVAVVSEQPSWKTIASLADERGLYGRPTSRADDVRAHEVAILVTDGLATSLPPHWITVERGRGWSLAVRGP